MIDLGVLERAVLQLDDAFALTAFESLHGDMRRARHFRAGAIRAFEFTYELSTKMIRRYLADTEPSPDTIERLDFAALIRLAYARGLLNEEIVGWREFRSSRSITSHTYDETKAEQVFAAIPRFLAEAKYLLAEINARQSAA